MDREDMTQRDIQVWNDAVAACRSAAFDAVLEMEDKAGDGMPNPARSVVRAVGALHHGGDDRDVAPAAFTFFAAPAPTTGADT